ncbi:MAG: hypothetical protein ACRDLN_01130 [Solirubrobacteraceae bacterium]
MQRLEQHPRSGRVYRAGRLVCGCVHVTVLRRRGAAAHRAVERADPIEVVVDDPHGESERIVGHLEPPQIRHGRLRAIEFELRWTR